MTHSDDTRLDQNVKRVDVGALVTVMNVSTQTRHHYYISADTNNPPAFPRNTKVNIIKPTDGMARALMTKMKGEQVFYLHNLVIEHIAWPIRPQ